MRLLKDNLNLERKILEAISLQEGVRLLILFGSLATGKANADSDLDLAIDVGRRLLISERISLMSILAEKIGRPVDLIDLQNVGEPLLGQILRYGKRLAGSNNHFASLISRHLFEQADFMPYRNRILSERRYAWIGK